MSPEKFDIVICSPPERERLVSEIYYNNVQFAEISEEIPGEFVIQFCQHPRQEYWEFSFSEIMEILLKAKKLLEGMGGDRT